MNRKSLYSLAIVIAVVAMAIIACQYFRWHNFQKKPLFFNTYGFNPEFVGPAYWRQDPSPIMDGKGDLVFFDFSKNEVAIVQSGARENPTCEIKESTPDLYWFLIGNTSFMLPVSKDTLLRADRNGVSAVRKLQPGEAKQEFDALYAQFNGQFTPEKMKKAIDGYLNQ